MYSNKYYRFLKKNIKIKNVYPTSVVYVRVSVLITPSHYYKG